MSKEKIIELIVCLLSVVALVLALTTNVFATGGDVGQLLGNSNSNNNNAGFSNIQDGNRNSNNLGNSLNGNSNSNNSNNNTNSNSNANRNSNNNVTEMPDTGVDYSVVIIIAICGVSAVYAYKKIRDYKNI